MSFKTEPTGYEKTALSDLQGAWVNLRNAVVDEFGFPNSDKLLFQIDEAMSWESVRNLNHMKSTLLLIRNITSQTESPEEVIFWVNEVKESLDGTFKAIASGKAK
ncbi:hypothetical protein [Shewanella surugensis]|uniref:Uncharacterized protein n=1 Tax=Shewanella surugensis TaxID=212020 RepID=A0ABT0LIM2_9GAMM|nr:hypothetical protein [Shewanella surugensis]MCL1127548.1 hypothetical protein [Shewanella surugensis]